MVKTKQEDLVWRPQAGFQFEVSRCKADIAIIGGSAGGGKTNVLVADVMKWLHIPTFNAVFFRRTMERVRATGGLLAETKKWYSNFHGGKLAETVLKWRFGSGAEVDFEGIEHLKDLDKWMGTQIPVIIFDELTEFEEQMFWFMLSRNRGIINWEEDGKFYKLKPYVRASCNPKPNSWVSRLLEWWIDQETGFPIPERNGVLRYMIRYNDKIYWGDTKDEVMASCPKVFEIMYKLDPSIKPHDLIKSFTFIRGRLSENKILTKNSPEYYSSLLSMSQEDQARFLDGNWKISSDGTDLFDFGALRNMFSEHHFEEKEEFIEGYYTDGKPIVRVKNTSNDNYITCDAAKFGKDLCVIFVWQGYTVVHITVFYKSSTKDIKDEIELQRIRYKVPRHNVVVDQDGLGGEVVKLGGYAGFIARRAASKDDDLRERENYFSFKDQCYFKAADNINNGKTKILITNDTTKIFYHGESRPIHRTKIRWPPTGGKDMETIDIRVVIQNHLSSIKKGDSCFEGGEKKFATNEKNEQKEILGGFSPDFADTIMMREYFSLVRRRKGSAKCY